MDSDQVLAKFFAINEAIGKQKNTYNEKEDNLEIYKITVSGKNALRLLLVHQSLNQRTIAKYTNISSQAVCQTVKKLEVLDLIQKKSGNINNETFIELTSKGKEVALILDRNIKAHAKDIFKNMSEEQLEHFYYLLTQINV